MRKETMQQVRQAQRDARRSEEFKRVMQEVVMPFGKDLCAFTAIIGFVAMLTVWVITTYG